MNSEKRIKRTYEDVYKYHNHDYPEWTDKNKECWVDVFLRLIYEYKHTFNYKYKKVLEIGCGNGRNLQLLFDKSTELYGIDISNDGIKKASSRYIGLFTCGSAKQLPYDDNIFDIVFSVHTLEQMKPIIKEVVKEIYRVLKPGGVYLCFEPFFNIQNKRGKWYHFIAYYPTGEIPFYLDEVGFIYDKIHPMKHKWGSTNIIKYLINRWRWICSRNRTGLIKAYKEK